MKHRFGRNSGYLRRGTRHYPVASLHTQSVNCKFQIAKPKSQFTDRFANQKLKPESKKMKWSTLLLAFSSLWGRNRSRHTAGG